MGHSRKKNKELYSSFTSGMMFGNLTILSEVVENVWTCECVCGNILDVSCGRLYSGFKKSCGCLRKKRTPLLEVGRKIFRLTIIKFAYEKERIRYYECLCDCGTIKIIREEYLLRSETKSCGCLVSETIKALRAKQLSEKVDKSRNQKFGLLTILELSDEKVVRANGTSLSTVKCRCDCGKVKNIVLTHVLNGDVKSCGCLNISVTKGGRKGLPTGEASFNAVYSTYKSGAIRKNLEFDLEESVFRGLVAGDCFYCGKPPSNTRGITNSSHNGIFTYNGIDRTVNSAGYLPENCVSCCKDCNFMKSNRDKDDFIVHIMRIAEHMKGKI